MTITAKNRAEQEMGSVPVGKVVKNQGDHGRQ